MVRYVWKLRVVFTEDNTRFTSCYLCESLIHQNRLVGKELKTSTFSIVISGFGN